VVPHVLQPRRSTTIALLALAAAVILLAAAPSAFAAAPPNGGWYPGPTLGSLGTGYAQFQWPLGVVVGSGGNLFVADYLNGRIEKLSAQGEYLGQTPYLGATADSIAIDHRGLVYVGTGAGIYVYDQNLDYLATISGYFGGDIFGMAFDSADNLYVSDISNDRIVVFDSAWAYQGHFGDGAFNGPWGLAVDSSNNLYVADISNSGIQVWTSGGSYLTTIASGTVSYTTQLTIRNDTLYADTYSPGIMYVLGLDGSYLKSIGGGSITSYGATVGPDGTAYIADFNQSVVDTFLFDGTPPTAWDDYDGQWRNGDVPITLYATDDESGLQGFNLFGTLWPSVSPFMLSLSTSPGHCGIVPLDYSATDNVGNQSAARTVFLKYDRVAPITTVSGLPSGNGMQPVTAVLQATDVGSGVYNTWYDLDAAGWALAPADGQIPVTTEGAHTLRYYSNDIAGNGEDVKEADFTLTFSAPYPWDTTAPTVTSDADGQWHSLETTVALAATDDIGAIAEMDYRVNGGSWGVYSYPPGIDIPDPQDHSNDGVKKIEFTATDDSDNTSAVQTSYVKIDTWKPRTVADATPDPASGWTNAADVALTFQAGDIGAGVLHTYAMDTNNTTSVVGPLTTVDGGTFDVTDEGMHVIAYFSSDSCVDLPNVETPKFLDVNIDRTAPVAAPTTNQKCATGKTIKIPVSLSDSLSPTTAVILQIKRGTRAVKTLVAGNVATTSTPTTVKVKYACKLKPGVYKIWAFAIDLAGNSGAPAGPKRLTVTK
jgi:hypothetical protein